MEYRWERTFPFLKIDKNIVNRLFQDILEGNKITNVIPIDVGCRTTNYIIETNNKKKKYILKIFFPTGQNYKKEIILLTKLKKTVPVSKIYKVGKDKDFENREYAIYEYIEGKTVGEIVNKGYKLDINFVRQVARALANIHGYKYDKSGFLDENLNIREELPPFNLWYENSMGIMAKKRLGKIVVSRIINIIISNKNILDKLDNDIRLIHGDFQGTNLITKDSQLVGILDWEFAMAGHPLGDIGQFFRYEEYFDENLINEFKNEYNKISTYKLTDDWYRISKLCDLVNLIQLIDTKEEMPIKHRNIKRIVIDTLKQF